MEYHTNLSITPNGPYEQVVPAILARAARDPEIVFIDRGEWGRKVLCFLRGSEDIEHERQRLRAQAFLPSDAILQIWNAPQNRGTHYWLSMSQAVEPDGRLHLVEFVKWILAEFKPCHVCDADTGKDLSSVAAERPDELFWFGDL